MHDLGLCRYHAIRDSLAHPVGPCGKVARVIPCFLVSSLSATRLPLPSESRRSVTRPRLPHDIPRSGESTIYLYRRRGSLRIHFNVEEIKCPRSDKLLVRSQPELFGL